ncbi:MAG: hypothetical protein VYE22_40370 [Myxococcota bacterium]|nr:hypothetical protein [Myxococcota bacterium]
MSEHEPLGRRRFLIAAGGALAGVACGGVSAADGGVDGGGAGDGGPGLDGGPLDSGTPDAGIGPSWLLPEGHYEGHFPLHVIYPRPDEQTRAYARHRHAYPGVLYEIPIGVQFGKWPYRYELLEGPAGARVVRETLQWNGVDAFEVPEGYGVVAWDVPPDGAPGPHAFTVRVYDQDHGREGDSYVDVTWTTTVGTEQFVFLDPLGGDDATADGTIDAPFREIATLQDSGLAGDKICYLRATGEFDPDDDLFAGGYRPDPPRQFRYGGSGDPKAYVAFPGETVHVNTAGQGGFAQSNGANVDVFFDGIVVGFTGQDDRSRGNVRVIMNHHGAVRSTYWRMGCVRAFGGTIKNDNHGFIWYPRPGGNVDDESGHLYLYAADCWMDRMNLDPGPDASFDGVGSNGPHLWSTYTTNRSLAERLRVSNSTVVNNAFVIVKGSARDGEIRACVTTEGNSGYYHIRALGSSSDGETRRVTLCYNKAGGDAARVFMGQAGSNPAYQDIIAYRNSCTGPITAARSPDAISSAFNNIARGLGEEVKIREGNVLHGGDLPFDDDLNLVGDARAEHLGTKGAEIA